MFDAAHPDALDVFARTIWAEARNQGRAGMEAVASVILNRAAHPRWWGKDVLSVCLARQQFSCWNADDPQYAAIRAIDQTNALFKVCLDVAAQGLGGHLVDSTNGADSYANLAVCDPSWAKTTTPCAKIGDHTFFRLELAAPAPKPVATVPTPAVVAAPTPPAASGLFSALATLLGGLFARKAA